jgi:cytoskeletal protein CcmA (bactofilin family)
MALWDKPESSTGTVTSASNPPPQPAATVPPVQDIVSKATTSPKERIEMKESLIAPGLSIEGKISGKGHVRVAGKFKGDIHVEGNLHIDADSKVEGQVKANEVIISGELQGNIENAKHVELRQGGVINGDVKAGSLTVATGARMRGNMDFGFDESAKPKSADSTVSSMADRSRETKAV